MYPKKQHIQRIILCGLTTLSIHMYADIVSARNSIKRIGQKSPSQWTDQERQQFMNALNELEQFKALSPEIQPIVNFCTQEMAQLEKPSQPAGITGSNEQLEAQIKHLTEQTKKQAEAITQCNQTLEEAYKTNDELVKENERLEKENEEIEEENDEFETIIEQRNNIIKTLQAQIKNLENEKKGLLQKIKQLEEEEEEEEELPLPPPPITEEKTQQPSLPAPLIPPPSPVTPPTTVQPIK